MRDDGWAGWRSAMAAALYGASGFYVTAGAPATGFRTSAHTGKTWAATIHCLATHVDEALGSPEGFTVLDVGAGGGELLTRLADLAPPRWRLAGVDLAPRPAGAPQRLSWSPALPEPLTGLIVAAELLDVIPVEVVERAGDGLRYVETTATGAQRLGSLVSSGDAGWLAQWWPLAAVGDRAEVGRPRDEMWRSLTSRLDRGVALAIDYAAEPARHRSGTLVGYRRGRQVTPVPDGSCDITAAVLFGSLLTSADVITTQREALHSLGLHGRPPGYDGDPAAHLAALSAAGEEAELLDPAGLGAFTWLIHARGVDEPVLREPDVMSEADRLH